MKILDSPYTDTSHLEVTITPALKSVSSYALCLISQIFQYVKTTLANLNADGHEYFQLLI